MVRAVARHPFADRPFEGAGEAVMGLGGMGTMQGLIDDEGGMSTGKTSVPVILRRPRFLDSSMLDTS